MSSGDVCSIDWISEGSLCDAVFAYWTLGVSLYDVCLTDVISEVSCHDMFPHVGARKYVTTYV